MPVLYNFEADDNLSIVETSALSYITSLHNYTNLVTAAKKLLRRRVTAIG